MVKLSKESLEGYVPIVDFPISKLPTITILEYCDGLAALPRTSQGIDYEISGVASSRVFMVEWLIIQDMYRDE